MRLFGLEINRKTDVLAVTAFLISVVSLSYSFRLFLQGAEMVLFQPTSLIIAAANYTRDDGGANGDDRYLVFITRFAYSNKGAVGYSGLVLGEYLDFRLSKRGPNASRSEESELLTHDWHAFVATTTKDGVFSVSSEMTPEFKSEAAPFVLAGGSSLSHETYFAARPRVCSGSGTLCEENRNFVPLADFLKWLRPLRLEDGGEEAIEFGVTLRAVVEGEGAFRGRSAKRRTCTTYLRSQDYDALLDPAISYTALPCLEGIEGHASD